jgi:hypothetical protein
MALDSSGPEALARAIKGTLLLRAEEEGPRFLKFVNLPGISPGAMLTRLVTGLTARRGAKAVLLVDEYDSPVSDNLWKPGIAEGNGAVLNELYGAFKDLGSILRLTFVTGITYCPPIWRSEALNHLEDLTLNGDFAGVCGFTEQDLDSCLEAHMEAALPGLVRTGQLNEGSGLDGLREKILKWYDGYSWDGRTRVMNPWSILKFLKTGIFGPHWLANRPAAKSLVGLVAPDPFILLRDRIGGVRPGDVGGTGSGSAATAATAALFQTGYLTLEPLDVNSHARALYTLRVPNWEIGTGRFERFSSALFDLLKRDPVKEARDFSSAVEGLDADRLTGIFNSLLAALPARFHGFGGPRYRETAFGYCYGMGFVKDADVLDTQGTRGTLETQWKQEVPDLLLTLKDSGNGGLRAAIEMRYAGSPEYDPDIAVKDRLAAEMAEEALSAANGKDYGISFTAKSDRLVRIGLGVAGRGRCRALISQVTG